MKRWDHNMKTADGPPPRPPLPKRSDGNVGDVTSSITKTTSIYPSLCMTTTTLDSEHHSSRPLNLNQPLIMSKIKPSHTIKISQELQSFHRKFKDNVTILFEYEFLPPSSSAPGTSGATNAFQSGGVSLSCAKQISSQWRNSKYVKLPHQSENTGFLSFSVVSSKKNKRFVENSSPVKKWDIIKTELAKLNDFITGNEHLDVTQVGKKIHASVKTYNHKVISFPFHVLNDCRVGRKLQMTFSTIYSAALDMENLFPFGMPILKKHEPKTFFLTQRQVRCILANGFLSTFPKRESVPELPNINFYKLFSATSDGELERKIEKTLCILNYFQMSEKHLDKDPPLLLSFERRRLPYSHPDWQNSRALMSNVEIVEDQGIESAHDKLQVDFANRFVGGGVLGNGTVMEEIRFSISPELIAARLFTEVLDDDEVLIITGSTQFSKYSGYGDSFKFEGPHEDKKTLDRDRFGRRTAQVAVMDAYHFRPYQVDHQFEKKFVYRELNKCFCAFNPHRNQEHIAPIATGNWGS
ncbi:poly(ADP-ribose) glycohydrolase isoform X2 [Folsomia candida]|uniref:poly(ADP-ribose) glycohydrolase isoform X2 n=1 Tax=Folsomia candida TaxID=158441 RepID=UPI000B8EEEF3|nr:poly(ADP-ribose) glycohydrolase isoform X2 [Folsomia candida]